MSTPAQAGTPAVWEPSHRFLAYALAILFAGSVAFLVVMAWLIPEQTVRFTGPVLGCLVSGMAYAMLRRGDLQRSVRFLVFGVWLLVTGAAALNGGVRSPAMIAYPPIIFLFGWLFGPRVAAAVAGMTAAVVAGLALAEAWKLLPAQALTPPMMYGLFQILVFVLTTVLILFLMRVYQSRQDELNLSMVTLAQRTRDLEISRASLSMAVEAAQIVFWEYDFGRDHLQYDADLMGWTDISQHANPGSMSAWLALVHAQDREAARQAFIDLSQPGGPDLDIQYRVADKTGTQWAWLHTRGRVVQRDTNGRALQAMGGSVDITSRKSTELALSEAKDRLERIFEEHPDVMVISSLPDSVIVDVNAAFTRLSGFQREEVRGLSSFGLGLWRDVDAHTRYLEAVQTRGRYENADLAFRSRDGTHYVGAMTAVVIQINGIAHVLNTVRDVTRQRRAEEKLRRSEALLRTTLESTDEGIVMTDAAGRPLSTNARFFEMWRVPLELALGGQDKQLMAHVLAQLEDPEVFMRDVQQLFDQGGNASDTLRLLDGRVFVRYTRALSVDGSYGRIWCYRDITELAQTQAALAEREEIYRSIVTQASDGIVLVDLESRAFVEFNDAACTALGYSRDEFARMGIPDIQAEHSPEKIAANMETLATLGAVDFETLHRHKDGSVRDVRVSNRRIALHGRSYVAAIITDITEARKGQRALQESHLFLDTLLNAVPLPIYYKGLDGRYLGFNPSFIRFHGSRSTNLIGKNVYDVELSALAGFFEAQDKELLAQGGEQVYESQIRDAQGAIKDVVFHKAALKGADGQVRGLIGVVVDVTQQKLVARALHASEQRAHDIANMLRLMCDNVPDMIWAKGLDNRYLFANKAMCEQLLLARDTDEPVGRDDMFFAQRQRDAHPEDPQWHTFGEVCRDSDSETLARQEPSQFDEYGNVRGQFMFLDARKAPFINDAGEVIGVVGSARNVTAQKAAEEKLRLASLVLQTSSEALMITDEANRIVEVNPAFCQVTGYASEEVLGVLPGLMRSSAQEEGSYRRIWQEVLVTGRWQGEIWSQRKGGEAFAAWLTVNTIRGDNGAVHRHVLLFSDITEKKRTEELIWSQANLDVLTRLPNRRMFYDHLRRGLQNAQRSGQRLALLFLDLDRFKEVNDTLGHEKGDILLVEAARRILGCVRESDTVARLGGDEFTIILPDLSETTSVDRIAEAILQALRQPFRVGEDVVYVSASIGVTLFPDDGGGVDDLLKNADQAMYVAKDHGRNRFSYFTSAMQEAAQSKLLLLKDLREALAKRQFELYFQPILDFHTGKVHKAEVLLRWVHPERGLVLPGEFITLAEEAGLIHEIGDWVFNESAAYLLRWLPVHGADFQISFNVSPLQIQEGDCGWRWPQQLKTLGLAGQNLVIEITEGLLLDNSEHVTGQLLAFRDAGMQVAIDDFGTGYSTLSYLKKLDIDFLKIDQSFIHGLVADASDKALVEAIVVMAHKLGLKVIAEGVETIAQRDILKFFGCDCAQGYLYSRPAPANEFNALLARHRLGEAGDVRAPSWV